MIIDYKRKNPNFETNKNAIKQLIAAIMGAFMFAMAYNLLIAPLNFYSGGILGISQLIRSFLVDFIHIKVPNNFDISGVIYYLINIPILVLAYKKLGKVFFYRTIILTSLFTVMLSIIRIPSKPYITDPLTSSIVAGVLCGFGIGYILRAGYSVGGQDVIGLYLTKYYKNFSVGKIGIIVNIFVFTICALLYNFEVVVYSFIFNIIIAFALDKVHFQNINVMVTIITKIPEVADVILNKTGRGVTSWDGVGAYTKEKCYIHQTMINKYEVEKINSMILEKDPKAFIIWQEGSNVIGNFEKRL